MAAKVRLLSAVFASLLLSACGPLVRPYYNRDIGGYLMPDPSLTPTAAVPAALKGVTLNAASLGGSASDAGRDAARLRKIAESYLGVPYGFGGQSRSGMDCSGFIRQVFQEARGTALPHNAASLYHLGGEVERTDLQPGDLVFFKQWGFVDHAGIYMGRNYFIHSATSVGVAYSSLDAPYFVDHYAGARRIER